MIDWSRVDDLRDEVGDEDFREVVDLFLDEVDEVIERMKHHPTHSSIEKDLHFLKGSSLNLGFAAFSSLCAAGERAARNGEAETVDLGQIFDAYAQSRATFVAKVVS
ncbi:MAG: Hpt domain-containing protein [Alphaproteobacteria bacterium]|nr:Hpt domain-containing protein [Alphaproteobacteria bacterium]MBU1279432.1 Hpt domain-containing protein [Alphaproteobacteria bacterium]MBU1572536.1 Hpt domain-containing protein [Alphaproteobacteria bacterium]MBU1830464.1 Hpt domain-containing protein [Alphaproteobacteria bacterium]MBU2076968.1 Hpt domain-containing protein [Alphaproteobacteria bacterium]